MTQFLICHLEFTAFYGHNQLQGTDRANYGDYLLESLSAQLTQMGLKRMDVRELRRFRQFYTYYLQIRDSLNPEFEAVPMMSKIALILQPFNGQ